MPDYAPTSTGLLAPLQPWLDDPTISEILLNQPGEIFIEKHGEMSRIAIPHLTYNHVMRLFQLIANENQQVINEIHPILSANLIDGSRIQCVIPPISMYPALAIRRQVLRRFTLDDYQEHAFYQAVKPFYINENETRCLSEIDQTLATYYHAQQWDRFIRMAIIGNKNIVISGGTASGKTTFLNACLHHIPASNRLLILEDTREIEVPHTNHLSLLAMRSKQTHASISMQDLLQCSLRLRPDRIIMGEIRGKEIMDFVGACATGHDGALTSVHASNPRVAFMRMSQMYKLNQVPSMSDDDIYRELHEVVDIIIQLERKDGQRKIQSIYYRYGDQIS